MDHGEDIKSAIAREMREEVGLEGDFMYRIVAVEDPAFLSAHGFWQIRLIFEVQPVSMVFTAGSDGDDVAFMNAEVFRESGSKAERRIYGYDSYISRPVTPD